MKEVTRITTVQITVIEKVADDYVPDKDKYSKELIEHLKGEGADDVVVLNVQDFIRGTRK